MRWFDGQPDTYRRWAEAYYERPVPPAAVAAVYAHQALTADIITALNTELTVADVAADAAEIRYAAD